jgi:hypothetical protein
MYEALIVRPRERKHAASHLEHEAADALERIQKMQPVAWQMDTPGFLGIVHHTYFDAAKHSPEDLRHIDSKASLVPLYRSPIGEDGC